MATQPRPKIKGAAPAPPTAISPQQLTERIRARAYELYEEHGKLEGRDLEDWLQAEAELIPTIASQA